MLGAKQLSNQKQLLSLTHVNHKAAPEFGFDLHLAALLQEVADLAATSLLESSAQLKVWHPICTEDAFWFSQNCRCAPVPRANQWLVAWPQRCFSERAGEVTTRKNWCFCLQRK